MNERVNQILQSIDARLERIVEVLDGAPPTSIDARQAYTRTQAARLLGVSVWTINRARKTGELIETRRIGHRDVRITGESMLRFVEARPGESVRIRKM